LACAAEANAETFTFTGGVQTFMASVSGEYAVELLGASGASGQNSNLDAGGLGAEVSGDVFLTAGEDLTLFVGGNGGTGTLAGGGGGGSFIFSGADILAVAGGGGDTPGGPGLAGANGGAGEGGGNGGVGGNGGDGVIGGGGAGVNTGRGAGYGGNGEEPGSIGGFGGKFPNGGTGSKYGGTGGVEGGGGGGSYLASPFTDRVLTAGVNSGNGTVKLSNRFMEGRQCF
jgi:hypothetical protein